jgi:quercetin dioxygenase-like cupin family protein
MTFWMNRADLLSSEIGWEFQGQEHDASVSFLIIEAPPGTGPKLHKHPYEEIFIVQEGQATFTLGEATLQATAGQIVVAPADVPHKFINSGAGLLRQVDIHPSPRMITIWLEE